jgi:hypothetical protein
MNNENNYDYKKLNDVFFISLTNTGYILYTLNCLKSLEKINFNHPLHCYCIGEAGYNILKNRKIPCSLINETENSDFQEFRKGKWSNVVHHKFEIIHSNLKKYKYVCITDGDIVYQKSDFMDYLLDNIKEHDMLIQNDTMSDDSTKNLCSGFMFIRSNKKTLEYFNPKNVKDFINKEGWGDQLYLNSIKEKLNYKMLPLSLFPNGKYYYTHANNIRPYLIHFNWVIGQKKMVLMKEYNKWLL